MSSYMPFTFIFVLRVKIHTTRFKITMPVYWTTLANFQYFLSFCLLTVLTSILHSTSLVLVVLLEPKRTDGRCCVPCCVPGTPIFSRSYELQWWTLSDLNAPKIRSNSRLARSGRLWPTGLSTTGGLFWLGYGTVSVSMGDWRWVTD